MQPDRQGGRLRPGTHAPLPDTLSPALREKYGLEDLDTAVRNIHFPFNAKALEAARHRLIFEELLTLTVGLKKLKGRKRTPTTPGH